MNSLSRRDAQTAKHNQAVTIIAVLAVVAGGAVAVTRTSVFRSTAAPEGRPHRRRWESWQLQSKAMMFRSICAASAR